MEAATAEPSIATLQLIALLTLHSLLDPRSGNIGQHIRLAVRLLIGLIDNDASEISPTLWALYPIIYIIENQVATALDRPNTLPEPFEPIDFSESNSTNFLCSLYRLQSRFRNKVSTDTLHLIQDALATLDLNATSKSINPNIVAAVLETQLLLEPSSAVAIRLLESYTNTQCIATFVTPHWIFRAGVVVKSAFDTSEKMTASELLGSFGLAVSLLTQMALRWPSAGIMADSIIRNSA